MAFDRSQVDESAFRGLLVAYLSRRDALDRARWPPSVAEGAGSFAAGCRAIGAPPWPPMARHQRGCERAPPLGGRRDASTARPVRLRGKRGLGVGGWSRTASSRSLDGASAAGLAWRLWSRPAGVHGRAPAGRQPAKPVLYAMDGASVGDRRRSDGVVARHHHATWLVTGRGMLRGPALR